MKLFVLLVFLMSTAHAAKCIAHRGDITGGIENSLDSIVFAVNEGADGVEFDIRHSSDGVPFLMHDSTLKRVADSTMPNCPIKSKVSKLKWSKIKEECRLNDGQEITSLSEMLY